MIEFLWQNFFKSKTPPLLTFLKQQILFSSLSDKELKVIEKFIHHRTYFPGETIFKPGKTIGLYMILKGKVQIFYGDSALISLKEGEFFGELSLVRETGYQKTTAKAAEALELYGLFRPEFMSLIETNPRLSCKVLMKLSEILGSRLQQAGEKLVQKSSQGSGS